MAEKKTVKAQTAGIENNPSPNTSLSDGENISGSASSNVLAETPKDADGEAVFESMSEAATEASEDASETDTKTSKKQAPKKKPAKKKPAKKRDNRSPLSKLRGYMPVLVILVCAIAFVANVPLGNISSFGWEAISAICPMGALSVFLASKTFVPRIIISIFIAIALVLLFGRAFCSWICTVPLVQRMLNIHSISIEDQRKVAKARERKEKRKNAAKKKSGTAGADSVVTQSTLSQEDRAAIAKQMSGIANHGNCAMHAKKFDSRHFVLGGSLLSAAIFGFPVFCLICPIGLSFATIFLVLRLFTGQVSWALVVVPLMLILELLVFRKWCYKICPVSALMSLISFGNKTFVPHVNKDKCIETSKGKPCSRCNTVCPEGINLHNLEAGEYGLNDCIKCRRCVDTCPTKAITMPFLPPKSSE